LALSEEHGQGSLDTTFSYAVALWRRSVGGTHCGRKARKSALIGGVGRLAVRNRQDGHFRGLGLLGFLTLHQLREHADESLVLVLRRLGKEV